MTIPRRAFLIAGGLGAVAASLGACVKTTTGTHTSYTLDVRKIKAYGEAGLNAAATVISALVLVPEATGYVKSLQNGSDTLRAALDNFTQAIGDNATIAYDTADTKTLVDSVFTNIDRILMIVEAVVSTALGSGVKIDSSVLSKIDLIRNALATIVSVFKALLSTYIATGSATAPTMSEAEALSILDVK